MSTQSSSARHEDYWVHDRFEEHDEHRADDAGHAVQGGDEDDQHATDDRVEAEEQRSADDGEQSSAEESADSEQDQSVGEELRSLGVGEASVLVSIVDEECTDGDLGADVTELSDEAERRSSLPESSVDSLDITGGSEGLGFGLQGTFRNFGQRGEDESGSDCNTKKGDGEVDVLHGGQVVGVFTREEVL